MADNKKPKVVLFLGIDPGKGKVPHVFAKVDSNELVLTAAAMAIAQTIEAVERVAQGDEEILARGRLEVANLRELLGRFIPEMADTANPVRRAASPIFN